MKDNSVEKEKIHVDFSGDSLPDSVKNFMPDVYRDGDRYVVVLGSEPEAITGDGDSVEAALADWDRRYREKKGI